MSIKTKRQKEDGMGQQPFTEHQTYEIMFMWCFIYVSVFFQLGKKWPLYTYFKKMI